MKLRLAAFGLALAASTVYGGGFTGLGFLSGNTRSGALDISEDGSTVGGVGNNEAWRWTAAGGMQSLGLFSPQSEFARVGGISADGNVITGYMNEPSIGRTPFRWSAGVLSNLDNNPRGLAFGVSANGLVAVGSDGDNAFRSQGGIRQPLPVPTGTNTGMTANPIARAASFDASVIVGSVDTPLDFAPPDNTYLPTPVRWTASGGQVIRANDGGLFRGFATDCTPDGSTIVGTRTSVTTAAIFLWTQPTGYQVFTPVGAITDGNVRIAADGSAIVVGNNYWSTGTGVITVAQLLTSAGCDFSGWTIQSATGISFDGSVICGYGFDPQGRQQAWVATVPGPGGLVVMAGVMVVGRRRRGSGVRRL